MALTAAFYAAAEGGVIRMEHLIQAANRRAPEDWALMGRARVVQEMIPAACERSDSRMFSGLPIHDSRLK